MKTEALENRSKKSNTIFFFIGALALSISLLSFVFHTTPLKMLEIVKDFAIHHYFLTGFISLVVFLICLKKYVSSDEEMKRMYNNRQINRINRRLKRKARIQRLTKTFSVKIQTLKSRYIDKSQVSNLCFSDDDVLDNAKEIEKRQEDLHTAMKIGNNYKHKVKLFFKDKLANKHTETTIWQADSTHVTLKGGVTLPVKSIYKVEL